MSPDLSGIASVQARVAAIESQFAAFATPRAGATTASTSPSSGASFDSVLDSALTSASSGSSATRGTSAATATGGTGGSGAVGTRALAAARDYLGVPYVWGGTDPQRGFDCSGLVQRAFADVGVDLPRVAADQARAGTAVPDLAHARPGDLVAFGSPVDHIGIYAGGGKMLVAPHSGDVVKIQSVYETPTAIRRIGGTAASSPRAASAAHAASAVHHSAPGRSALGADVPASLRGLFTRAEQRYGVPARLLSAVARAESGYNPNAVSPAGAIGLMQLMPGTARGLGVDPRNPAQAVDGAARLLADHLKTFKSTSLALAAYNAGPGAVQRYGGIPPYSETQQYVRRVLSYAGGSA